MIILEKLKKKTKKNQKQKKSLNIKQCYRKSMELRYPYQSD